MKFNLGQLVMTRAINDRVAKEEKFAKFIYDSLDKYKKCDWGELCEEDKQLNNEAVANGDRIVAAYIYDKNDVSFMGEGKIYIITEWDRSATTILYPHEY